MLIYDTIIGELLNYHDLLFVKIKRFFKKL